MNLFKPFLSVLNTLHSESKHGGADTKNQWDSRPAIVLMVAALCLLLLNYLKYNTVFNAVLEKGFELFSNNPVDALYALKSQTFFPILSQAWWSFLHVLPLC